MIGIRNMDLLPYTQISRRDGADVLPAVYQPGDLCFQILIADIIDGVRNFQSFRFSVLTLFQNDIMSI